MKNQLKSTVLCMVVLVLSCEDVEGVQQILYHDYITFNVSFRSFAGITQLKLVLPSIFCHYPASVSCSYSKMCHLKWMAQGLFNYTRNHSKSATSKCQISLYLLPHILYVSFESLVLYHDNPISSVKICKFLLHKS